jgi:pimeloyl-ACP methyl ester carboxylesterase
MHLGFDSIKEELIPIINFFREADLELYIFEGPGQGEALYKYNLPMMHEYEKPVKAVLDHFKLSDVTLIGLSLGGYLAPRAAIFENRVSRVIIWGVLYDFFDTVLSRRGKFFEYFLKTLLALHASFIVNTITRIKMKRDTFAKWGVEHGMGVYDAKSPYDYFKKIKMYSMKKISHLVKQDFLLLASTEDHFIPKKHVYQQIEKLTNVRSLTARIFTKHENAENHVSFSNVPLVLGYMINWIKEHTTDPIKAETNSIKK